jgi:hypothetical protein
MVVVDLVGIAYQRANPDFSPEGKMIAQRLVFTRGFLNEQNTGCLSEGIKFLVGTKIKRGIVILVRNQG